MKDGWYLERYKKNGLCAETHWMERDFATVRPHVVAARQDLDHILRVIGPANASQKDLSELVSLGARPNF